MTLDRTAAIELAFTELGHVFRFRTLVSAVVQPTSAKMVADGKPVPLVSHHVRTLAERGLIKEHHKEKRRGAVETFYVATPSGKKLIKRLNLGEDAGA